MHWKIAVLAVLSEQKTDQHWVRPKRLIEQMKKEKHGPNALLSQDSRQLHRFRSNEMNEMKREPNENQTKHHLP